MNTIEEKQIDELAAYKGKWACLFMTAKRSFIGSTQFNTREDVQPLIRRVHDGKLLSLEEAARAGIRYKHDRSITASDVKSWFPIPVKS